MASTVGAWGSVLLAAAVLAFAGPAFSQTPAADRSAITPSRQELNPDERPAPGRRRATATSSLRLPALPCPLASSTLTFRLEGVEIVGATISAADAAEAYAGLVGKDIPVSKICEIRDRLTSILFAQHRLARVEVPEQTIAGGRPAHRGDRGPHRSVRVRGDVGAGQDKVEGYLEKLRGMTPFDLDVAQRYLLLANDVPGVGVSAALRPSAEGRGAIDLEVQLSRTPGGLHRRGPELRLGCAGPLERPGPRGPQQLHPVRRADVADRLPHADGQRAVDRPTGGGGKVRQ